VNTGTDRQDACNRRIVAPSASAATNAYSRSDLKSKFTYHP
jgi:hypothetical protein